MAQHKLEHAKLKLQQMSLSAPEAGTVVSQVPGVGAFVQAGKPAISLLPAPAAGARRTERRLRRCGAGRHGGGGTGQ